MIFTTTEQPRDPVAYNQWHKRKMAYVQCLLLLTAFNWILQLLESYKNDWSAFVSAFKKQFFFTENCILRASGDSALTEKETEKVRH